MSDRREEILNRLHTVTLRSCVADADHCMRNQLNLPEKLRPAIIMFDGDEQLADDVDSYGKNRPRGTPVVMVDLIPEIYMFDEGKAEEVGQKLSAFRVKILKAIYEDETLVALCANGDIRYLGLATGFATGRKIEAEAGIQLSFRYVLRPSQL